ncbi:MAG TPA: DHA2 family efflux MFS transporter permease subunit [Stellaceae bacterium]|nr:DHA2 family efflux MFS transporter permease subunit [Stellaceae bacterium]
MTTDGAARPVNPLFITAAVVLASMIQAIDTTIANVALPYMRGSLSASEDEINWVLTSYITAAAIMTPPTGWLTARLGRRRMFLIAVVGFTLASVLCGMAESLTQIVLFRILQGVFGASLIPLAQAVIIDTYPPEKQGSAMSLWAMGVMVGPVLGPTLGGWLTENYDWRWVFFLNVPVGAACLVLMWLFLPDTPKRETRFDWTGFATLSLGIGALQMMLDRGQEMDWFGSTEILVEACLAGLGFYLFLAHSVTTKTPFINFAILRDRNYVAGLVFIFTISAVISSTMSLMTPFLQGLANYPVETAGLLMAPRGIGMIVAVLLTGRYLTKYDPRVICFLGFAIAAATLWDMTRWTADVSSARMIWVSVFQGAGLGIAYISLQPVIFVTLPRHLTTEATSFYSLFRNTGQSVAISIVSALLVRNTQVNHASISQAVTPFNRALQQGAAAQFWNLHTTLGQSMIDETVTRQASIIAYIDNFKLVFLMTLCAMPVVLLIRVVKRKKQADEPAHAAAMD